MSEEAAWTAILIIPYSRLSFCLLSILLALEMLHANCNLEPKGINVCVKWVPAHVGAVGNKLPGLFI